MITAFFGANLIYLVVAHPVTGSGSLLGATFRIAVYIGAFLILAYPGLLLSRSPSIPFWNTGLLPLVFILQGLTSGLAWGLVCLIARRESPFNPVISYLLWSQVGLLAILLVSIGFYLAVMNHAGAAARESTQILVRGDLAMGFNSLGLFAGILMPLIMMMWAGMGGDPPLLPALIAAIGKSLGDFFARHAFIKAGMYDRVY
jgi:formate-dependent nitrite reductase membrane component NrfD